MNLFDLKIVLRQIRSELKCPHCKAEYPERKIEILGTDSIGGTFMAECKDCKHSIIINILIERRHRKIVSNIQKYFTVGEKISTDDILDIHNTLNDFKGDVTQLFSVQKDA